MSTIWDWSTVADNNDDSDDAINWLEGQLPSTVNGSARAMMMRLAQYLRDQGVLTAGGTANAITITANSPITTPINGMTLAFRAASTNTGAVTLSVNGGGSKAIRKVLRGGSADVALGAGDINTKGVYVAHYDSTANTGAGAWILINPTLAFDYLPLTGGTLTGNLTIDSGTSSSLYVQASGNRHVWFRDENGVEKGLLYSESATGDTRIRVAGSKYFNFKTDGSFTLSGAINTGGGTITSGDITSGSISATGLITSTGTITARQNFQASTANAILGSTGAGAVYLRPNGVSSTSGQAYVNSGGDLVSSGRVYAGGSSGGFMESNGNVQGSIWTSWGSSQAFAAIDSRIESRAAAYAASAQNASMPKYTGTSQHIVWGATSTWQNTTGRIAIIFAFLTGGSSTATSLSISPNGGSYFLVGTAATGTTSSCTTVVPPGGYVRGTMTTSGSQVDMYAFY